MALASPFQKSSTPTKTVPRAKGSFWNAFGYLLPALLIFALFTYYPLFRVMYLSLTDADFLKPTPNFVGLQNYQTMLASREFYASLVTTMLFALGVTFLEVGLGLCLGFLMNAKTRVQGLLRGAVFAPVVISIAATAIVWMFLLNTQGGPINSTLNGLGLPSVGWLTDPNMALVSVILVSVWKGVGLSAVLFLSGLQGISRELEEAAVVDGANRWQIASRITLPLLSPTTFVVLFISLVGTFQSYGLVLLLTQGGPVGSTTLLGYFIYQNAFQFFQMGYASALSVALFLLLAFLAFVQFKISESKVHYQ
jgi:multiple sugar transport system permease protein